MDPLHIVLPATVVFVFRKRLGEAYRTLVRIPVAELEKRVRRRWRSWRRRPLKRRAKVAIVGAGVGGSAAAFFLKDALGDDVELHVYEASDRVGGRCRHVEFPRPERSRPRADADGGEPADADRTSEEPRTVFETGASIVSELNLYFRYFMKLGHFRKNDRDVPDLPQVIFGGRKERVFASEVGVPTKKGFVPLPFTTRLKIADKLTLLKVIRKYGFFQLRKLKGLLKKKKVLDFGELYKQLNGGEAFETVEELIQLTGCTGGSCGRSGFGIFRNSPDETITPSDLLQMSAYDTIKAIDEELKDPVLNDLVSPNMRCNYGGQGLHDLHGFVGMVSVAGGICSSCFSVKDGNRDVIVNLLENETEVEHLCLNTRVERVQLTEGSGVTTGGKYNLHLSRSTRDADGVHVASDTWQESEFDVVIYAAPLINKSTPSENRPVRSEKSAQSPSPKDAPVFQPEVLAESDRSKYRRCVCTLVQGELNQDFFGKVATGDSKTASKEKLLKSKDSLTSTERLPYLSALTSADSEEVPFYSLSLLFPCNRTDLQKYITEAIDKRETVFKIFSSAKLSDETLGELFVDYDPLKTPVHVDDWLAYPEYTVPQSLSTKKFALSESDTHLLLYSNPIELSAGAMEMSAIGGKNAANYCVKWLRKNLK